MNAMTKELPCKHLAYGTISRGSIPPISKVNQADLFKGRYRFESLTIEATCHTTFDLRVLLEAIGYQTTLIDYIISECIFSGHLISSLKINL